MKCPVCQTTFSDLRDICPKCLSDLRSHKKAQGIAVTYPDLAYTDLLQRSGMSAQATAVVSTPTPAPIPAAPSTFTPPVAASPSERDAFGFTATERLETSLTFAEAARAVPEHNADGFELGFSQLFKPSESEDIKLLFDVADESLVNPEAAKRLEQKIVRRESRQIENKELSSHLARISHVLEVSAVRLKNMFGHGAAHEEAAPEIRIVPAAPADRAAAGVLDLIIIVVLSALVPLGYLFLYRQQSFVDLFGLQVPSVVELLLPGAIFLCAFLWIAPLYLSACAAAFGKTIGMRACKLVLVRMNGRPPRALNAFVRGFSLPITALGLGVIPWIYGERCPHDRLSGTAVVPAATVRKAA